jgi:hypothetical protein
MPVSSLRLPSQSVRAVFADNESRPIRLWTNCVANGVTLSVTTTLESHGKTWDQTWIFANRRRINPVDSWFPSILGKPIPIRSKDATLSPRRIEIRLPWPWTSRLIFVRPSESLYCSNRDFMGYHMPDLQHHSEERDIDAMVFAMLKHDTVCIVLHPGSGLANGGIHVEVPLSLIPKDLRVSELGHESAMRSRESAGSRESQLHRPIQLYLPGLYPERDFEIESY